MEVRIGLFPGNVSIGKRFFPIGRLREVERGLGVVERFFICGRAHEEPKMWNQFSNARFPTTTFSWLETKMETIFRKVLAKLQRRYV